MERKKIFVPKARVQNGKEGIPKALLGRVFVALSIGIVFVLVLALVWKQKAQPPIGDNGDTGKPKLYREIPKTTVPEPQVLSLDKAGPTAPKEAGPSDRAPAPASPPEGQSPAHPLVTSPTEGTPETTRSSAPDTKNVSPAAGPRTPGASAPSGVQPRAAKAGPTPSTAPSAKTESPAGTTVASAPQNSPVSAAFSGSWAYAVQVGAYSQKENAQQALQRLKKLGFQPEISPFDHPKLGLLYAVRIAPFASQAEAQKAAEKISGSEKDQPIIVKVPKAR